MSKGNKVKNASVYLDGKKLETKDVIFDTKETVINLKKVSEVLHVLSGMNSQEAISVLEIALTRLQPV